MATLTKGKTFTNGELVTPQKLHELVDLGTVSGIVNADISATAAIADNKLAQISTANKVANSATSATSANTANAIVARDSSGNFSAGTISAALSGNATTATTAASCSGNAATATTLQTARTINGVSFNGSANITVTADPNAHTHGNITNAGAIGTTDSLPIITGTSGVLQAGSFGTTAGTFCQGNDSRLSDARTPAAHTHDDRYYTETEVNTLLSDKQKINGQISNGLNWNGNTGILFNIPENVKRLCLVVEKWSQIDAGQGIVLVGTNQNGILDAEGPIVANSYWNNVNNVESFQGFSITGRTNTTLDHTGVFDFFICQNPDYTSTNNLPNNRLVCRSNLQQYNNGGTWVSTLLNGAGYIDFYGVLNQILLRPMYGSTNPHPKTMATLYYYY
jgi:hypothetical protein